MNPAAAAPERVAATPGPLLVVGVVMAVLTEAIAGTVLSLGRNDIIGDTHATPDEFAWLDVGYAAMKFVGFLLAPWAIAHLRTRRVMIGATLAMGLACLIAAVSVRLDLLIALRGLQGLSGGLLLVTGQTLLFLAFPSARQPLLQAVFAMGSVVAPATLAPALQGWLIDMQSWTWIFFGVFPLALAAAGILLMSDVADTPAGGGAAPFDGPGFLLLGTTAVCLSYVLIQGNRWDWFQEPRIAWFAGIGAAALLGWCGRQLWMGGDSLPRFSVFANEEFCFAFVVSFVAGAALFGSGFLIPSFAVSVLGFTLADAGLLLLPSGALFVIALLLAAYLMQARRVPPVATVPFGILMIMVAMWMLSGSSRESGADDMMAAILLRGLGLGLLFLSITLIAFSHLRPHQLASGIGLFDSGRQLGGLVGVAGLQTLIEHETHANATVLGTHLATGGVAVAERLAAATAVLADRGLDPVSASHASLGLVGRAMTGQTLAIAFETAFMAVALLFVVAVPALVATKIVLVKHAARAG